jgi:SAM-dependent methyltransferase
MAESETAATPTADRQIGHSVRAYRKLAARYAKAHTEIFNEVEQGRLRAGLSHASSHVTCADPPATCALDFGCGSGNLTDHLVNLGFEVVAADVSPDFLELVEDTWQGDQRVSTLRLNGRDLASVPDGRFGLVGAYSVLHHIPDYLVALDDLVRVLAPGGVLYLDHEVNDDYWSPDEELIRYREHAARYRTRSRFGDGQWRRYLRLQTYQSAVMRRLKPRFQEEGDIHVWPDDHVEWDLVEERLREAGCEIVRVADFLGYSSEVPRDVYEEFSSRCTDMRSLIARRRPS